MDKKDLINELKELANKENIDTDSIIKELKEISNSNLHRETIEQRKERKAKRELQVSMQKQIVKEFCLNLISMTELGKKYNISKQSVSYILLKYLGKDTLNKVKKIKSMVKKKFKKHT